MIARRWASLVVTSIRRARRSFLLAAFGIGVGIASLAFFTALSAGVRRVVLGEVFRVDRLEVEPARSSFDLAGALGGGAPRITDETVAALAGMPGVRAAWPRMRIGFPAKAWGGAEFFGKPRYAELLGDGIDPAAVADQGFGPLRFDDLEGDGAELCYSDPDCKTPGEYCAWDVHRCLKPTPAIISRYLVELYNGAFAGQHNLPRINDFVISRFRGFTFTIELGASFVGPQAARGTPRQRRVMLVGVSDRAVPIGLSFPLPYVRRWNREYGGAGAADGYSSVTVEVADKGALAAVAAKARTLGLQPLDNGAEQAGVAITLVALLFWLVSLSIVAVATINIAHSYYRAVAERRREIGVLRAVGASAADIRRLLLGEAAAVGLAGGVGGLLAARAVAAAVDLAARHLVPDFPFKPATFFHFSPLLVLGVLGFAVLACLAGAYLPARAAARLEPAEALTAI